MAANLTNLFGFDRPLPDPFKASAKKVSVSSKYGDKTQATLCCSVIKAVHAFCDCKNGNRNGAVGTKGSFGVAEYNSSMGPSQYHLVVFNSATGDILASIYDKDSETIESYPLKKSGRDGAAVLFAMMPALMGDAEFSEQYENYCDMRKNGYPDQTKAEESMAILCDNVYRRLNDASCPAHIPVKLERAGNLMRISQAHLDSGSYTPDTVVAGAFSIFTNTAPIIIHKASALMEHSDFVGKFQLNPARTFSVLEQSLVPKLPDWYIIPTEVADICKHAALTTNKAMPMRNFLLRGPAGTGKTMGAQAIAAGLGLPYMKYTCSAGTEIFDFIGQVFPETDSYSTGDAELDKELETLKAMGGISYDNVKTLMNLPDLDDMDYDIRR